MQLIIQTLKDAKRIDHRKQQATLDYAHYLEHRSRELLRGGVLILGILADSSGQDTREHVGILYRYTRAFLSPQELLDYTLPIYPRSCAECVDRDLLAKHNFELIKADIISVKSPLPGQLQEGVITLDYFARTEILAVRSPLECPLKQALLINNHRSTEDIENVLNRYWAMYETEVKQQPNLLISDLKVINLVLRKLKE